MSAHPSCEHCPAFVDAAQRIDRLENMLEAASYQRQHLEVTKEVMLSHLTGVSTLSRVPPIVDGKVVSIFKDPDPATTLRGLQDAVSRAHELVKKVLADEERAFNRSDIAKKILAKHFPNGDAPKGLLLSIFSALGHASNAGFARCYHIIAGRPITEGEEND